MPPTVSVLKLDMSETEKQSSISTNFRSSNSKTTSVESSLIHIGNYMIGGSKIEDEKDNGENKKIMSLLRGDLEEVESLGESSNL